MTPGGGRNLSMRYFVIVALDIISGGVHIEGALKISLVTGHTVQKLNFTRYVRRRTVPRTYYMSIAFTGALVRFTQF